jgi:hypothetical protein
VFVWMCGTRTSAVCFSGCVGLKQVMRVCFVYLLYLYHPLDVWDSDKCCVFDLFIYCICTLNWMCGTRTRAVCLSGCVGLRQVLCVCLDVWDSDKCCVFVWMCGPQIQTNTQHLSESHTSRQTHSTCPSPTHPGDGTDTVNKKNKHTALVWVPRIQTNTQHLCESHTFRQTHSTCLIPTHPDKHTALI